MSAPRAAADGDAVSIKVLLIGDSGVGKSSLLLSFTTDTFDENQSATIGIDFKVKCVDVLENASGARRQVRMQLWDTAGQERFRTLTSSYYRGAHAVVLVYDVNEPRSFYNLDKWLEEARAYGSLAEEKGAGDAQMVYLLIGNKVDLCDGTEMAVSLTAAQGFARQHHMHLVFTSAKTRQGVAQAFDEVARAVYDRLQESPTQGLPQARQGRNLFSTPNDGITARVSRCCR